MPSAAEHSRYRDLRLVLSVRPALTTSWLKLGYALLLTECALYAAAYAWLALRA